MDASLYQIIPALPHFADEIAAIETSTFSHPWSHASILTEMERTDSVFLVCFTGDALCGYINCRNVCGEGYIGNVAVKHAFRRQGIGRMLLQKLAEKAKELDMLFLANVPGFIPIRPKPHYYIHYI